MNTIPSHFVKTKIHDPIFGDRELVDWIEAKLSGRYSISSDMEITDSGRKRKTTFVGFEDQKELTYFILACPHVRRN